MRGHAAVGKEGEPVSRGRAGHQTEFYFILCKRGRHGSVLNLLNDLRFKNIILAPVWRGRKKMQGDRPVGRVWQESSSNNVITEVAKGGDGKKWTHPEYIVIQLL